MANRDSAGWTKGAGRTGSRVAVIIPARDEADVIGPSIQSLLQQNYPGLLQIFVVDDHSTDETATVAKIACGHSQQVTLSYSTPLPPGWTGKMWALAQGVEKAAEFSPEYFLFTDADIVHAQGGVTSLVAMAQANRLDLVSMMVKLRCESFAERALIPAFVYFFFMLYPPEWVNDSGKKRVAAAAGGDILVRTEALARMGGIGAIRGELIDDCALARQIKRNGSIWMGLSNDTQSIRRYHGFREIGRMISRSAFYQLRHSFWLLIGTLLAIGITFVVPPMMLAFGGWTAILGGLAWLLMTLSFLPMVRFYQRSGVWALSLPLVALFYAGATLHSAVQYWMGRGGEWKGRVQDTAA